MFINKYNNNDNLEKSEKQRPWVFFVIGFSIWTICILILVVSFKYNGTSNSVSNFFNFNRYTTSYDICPKDGPAMSIFIELFLAFAEVYFYIVYLSKSKALPPKDNLVKG